LWALQAWAAYSRKKLALHICETNLRCLKATESKSDA